MTNYYAHGYYTDYYAIGYYTEDQKIRAIFCMHDMKKIDDGKDLEGWYSSWEKAENLVESENLTTLGAAIEMSPYDRRTKTQTPKVREYNSEDEYAEDMERLGVSTSFLFLHDMEDDPENPHWYCRRVGEEKFTRV